MSDPTTKTSTVTTPSVVGFVPACARLAANIGGVYTAVLLLISPHPVFSAASAPLLISLVIFGVLSGVTRSWYSAPRPAPTP